MYLYMYMYTTCTCSTCILHVHVHVCYMIVHLNVYVRVHIQVHTCKFYSTCYIQYYCICEYFIMFSEQMRRGRNTSKYQTFPMMSPPSRCAVSWRRSERYSASQLLVLIAVRSGVELSCVCRWTTLSWARCRVGWCALCQMQSRVDALACVHEMHGVLFKSKYIEVRYVVRLSWLSSSLKPRVESLKNILTPHPSENYITRPPS